MLGRQGQSRVDLLSEVLLAAGRAYRELQIRCSIHYLLFMELQTEMEAARAAC